MAAVKSAAGKDVFLLCGSRQIGKSTTCNALRGLLFTWGGDGRLVMQSGTQSDLSVAEMGKGNLLATKFLALYQNVVPNSPAVDGRSFVFVDTRGVSEIAGKLREAEIMAAAILTEMIIRAAKSVKIVAIDHWAHLEHLPSMSPLLTLIGELVESPGADVFWLFLKHPLNGPHARHPLDGALFDQIIAEMTDRIESQTTDALQHFQDLRAEGAVGTIDAEQKVYRALHDSHKAGRVGYFDPVSPWSVGQLRNQLAALPPIALARMKVGVRNPRLHAFNHWFEGLLVSETRLLRMCIDFAGCAPGLIPTRATLKADMRRFYKERKAHAGAQQNCIGKEIALKTTEIDELSGKKELLWIDTFNEHWGMLRWWRYHRTTLPAAYKDVLAWKVFVQLEKGTSVCEVLANKCPDFDVWYESKIGSNCKGTVQFWIQSEDRPSTRQVIERLKADIERLEQSNMDLSAALQLMETDERRAIDGFMFALREIAACRAGIEEKLEDRRSRGIHEKLEEIIKGIWRWDESDPTGPRAVHAFCHWLAEVRRIRGAAGPSGSTPNVIELIQTLARIAQDWNQGIDPIPDPPE